MSCISEEIRLYITIHPTQIKIIDFFNKDKDISKIIEIKERILNREDSDFYFELLF